MTDGLEPSVQQHMVILPTNSGERINAMAHFHRAEMGRMAGWRDRIDRTSNWAITVAAAMLSVSLSTPASHHGVLLFAMLLVYLLLRIEARRYRFFDVYRARVRQFERYYFAQIFSPMPEFASDWQLILGENLRKPRFLISYADAFSKRLRRNYIWMFLILLLAWSLKIATLGPGDPVSGFADAAGRAIANAGLGPLPGWALLTVVALVYARLLYSSLRPLEDAGESGYGEVHV